MEKKVSNIPGFDEQVEGGVGHIQAQIHVTQLQIGVDHGLDLQ
jgi:hypothetical protein